MKTIIAATVSFARRHAASSILVLSFSLALSACGGGSSDKTNDDQGSESTPSTASLFGPDIEVSVGEPKTISVADADLMVAANDLITPAKLSLARTQDPDTQTAFMSSLYQLAPGDPRGNDELRARISPAAALPDGKQLVLRIKRPATADAGSTIKIFVLRQYVADDDDGRNENYDFTDEMEWATDPDPAYLLVHLQRKNLTIDDAGNGSIVLRAVVMPGNSGSAMPTTGRARALVDASKASCWEPTETEEERNTFSNPLNTQLRIVGPYSEPGHSSPRHPGIDFQASQKSKIYAVRAGYIEYINERPSKKPGQTSRWEVIVKHPDGEKTAYLHVTPGSVVDTAKGIDSTAAFGTAPTTTFQSNWSESDSCHPRLPVLKGQLIALSGDSGAKNSPHLHLHAYAAGKFTHLYNPILKLGRLSVNEGLATVLLPGAANLQIDLLDNSLNLPIQVRRKRENIFSSVAAQSDRFPVYSPVEKGGQPSHYNWPVIKLDVSTESDAFGAFIARVLQQYPDKTVDFHGLHTDTGLLGIEAASGKIPENLYGGGVLTVKASAVSSAVNDPAAITLPDGTQGYAVTKVEVENDTIAPAQFARLSVRVTKPVLGALAYFKDLPYTYQWIDEHKCFSSQSMTSIGLMTSAISDWDGKKCLATSTHSFDLLHNYQIDASTAATGLKFIDKKPDSFFERTAGVSPILKIGSLSYDMTSRIAEVVKHLKGAAVRCLAYESEDPLKYTELQGFLVIDGNQFILSKLDGTQLLLGQFPSWRGPIPVSEIRTETELFVQTFFYGYNDDGRAVSMAHTFGGTSGYQLVWQQSSKTDMVCTEIDLWSLRKLH